MTLTFAVEPTATDTGVVPPDRPEDQTALTRSALTHTALAQTALTELCRDLPGATDLFFSEELARITEAKRLCALCPAIVSCLEGAISRAEPCGVWGGQLFERGRIVRIKRRRGRPSKHPRPEDLVLDLPIPEHLLIGVSGRRDGRELLTA